MAGTKAEFDFKMFSEACIGTDNQMTILDNYDNFVTINNQNVNDGVVMNINSDIWVNYTQVTVDKQPLNCYSSNLCYNVLAIYRSFSMDTNDL